MIETALARAQAGDGEAFRELVEPYGRELQACGSPELTACVGAPGATVAGVVRT